MAEPEDEKVLASIKSALGLGTESDAFDFELKMHINSVVATLRQLGIGPLPGLIVTEETKWVDLLVNNDEHQLEGAKSLVFLKVRMIFDGHNMSAHVIAANERMIQEAEWRVKVAADPMIPQLVSPVLEDV